MKVVIVLIPPADAAVNGAMPGLKLRFYAPFGKKTAVKPLFNRPIRGKTGAFSQLGTDTGR
jgi:hypothetical protein